VVTVPAGTTALRLTGYWSIDTDEGTYPWDFVTIELRTETGAEDDKLLTYSNADATTGWLPLSATAEDPRPGSTRWFAIHATTDEWSDITSFFFDTLVLEATVCP
jgi:hypothetical protein